ncbi:MAG TPA: metal ABC transporter permease [Thermomicrobiales bacterium]|nr:metal ABC transporter permease [Thermomicrobiales bacterium]
MNLSFAAVIVLTGVLTASACALVGSFLVLRRMSMVGDAISHTVILGIVGMFAITHSRAAPLMILGAAVIGLLTVFLIELVHRSGRIREDGAIGLVFPALFAIGVIIVSRFPSGLHLDVQHVLYGEITFVPLRRLELFGRDLGYESLWVLGGMAVANLLFVLVFYKELKLATFDPGLAASLGFSPVVIHYALMAMVSATTVVSFDIVGAILVVAMLIVPPATAYLLTDRLPVMIALAVVSGAASAVGGYLWARSIDGSISGAMAAVAGGIFAFAFVLSPRHGVISRLAQLARLRREFGQRLLITHLEGQHGTAGLRALRDRFRWTPGSERAIVRAAIANGLVKRAAGDTLVLTERGRSAAQEFATD